MKLRGLLLILAITATAHTAELTNAAAVLEFVLRQSAQYNAFAADFIQTQWLLDTPTQMTGTIHFQKPAQTRLTMHVGATGAPPQQVVAVMGADQILWQETASSGPPTAMKMDLTTLPTNHPAAAMLKNPFDTVDPQRFVARIRNDYTQTLTGTAELNGQKMYILDGTLNPKRKLPGHLAMLTRDQGRQRLLIGQTDGFVHQVQQFDSTNTNLIMTIEFTNLKLNPDLPADLFRYEPTAGVRVIDMTAILLQLMKSTQKP
ncbi:MAG: hypothetical protein PCFJNLEI_01340 [Verrucomicrobiae bacterium]|nr:hypothetical protein [Verrucomicrobiae bacterium]